MPPTSSLPLLSFLLVFHLIIPISHIPPLPYFVSPILLALFHVSLSSSSLSPISHSFPFPTFLTYPIPSTLHSSISNPLPSPPVLLLFSLPLYYFVPRLIFPSLLHSTLIPSLWYATLIPPTSLPTPRHDATDTALNSPLSSFSLSPHHVSSHKLTSLLSFSPFFLFFSSLHVSLHWLTSFIFISIFFLSLLFYLSLLVMFLLLTWSPFPGWVSDLYFSSLSYSSSLFTPLNPDPLFLSFPHSSFPALAPRVFLIPASTSSPLLVSALQSCSAAK